jgi:hypothetical protein
LLVRLRRGVSPNSKLATLNLAMEAQMENPYKIKLPSDVNTGQLQEKELISIKDDSTKPPPTIGTPSWVSIYMGSAAGQPSSDMTTFEHVGATKGPFLFSARFWLLLIVAAIIAYFVYTLFNG